MALNFIPVDLGANKAPAADRPVEDVPADIRQDVEDAWAHFTREGAGVNDALRVVFPDKAAKNRWVDLARVYATHRKTVLPKEEALYLRVSPIRKADEKELTFRLRTLASEQARAAQTEANRAATAKAKESSK